MAFRSAAEPWRDVALACLVAAALALCGVGGAPAPVIGVALVGALVVAVFAPVAALGAVLLTLPYFYHPLVVAGARLAASELLLGVAAAGIGARASARFMARPRAAAELVGELLRSPLWLAALALAALGALWVAFPYDPTYRGDALREWRWTLLEPWLLLALLLAVARGDAAVAARRVAAWCFLLGAAVAAAHGLSNLATGGGVNVEGVRRVSGPYPHPNALALYALRGAVFGLAWAAWDRRARLATGVLGALCLAAVAATYSRGAYAAAGIALLLVAWQVAPRLRWLALAGAGVAIIAAVALAGQRMLNLFSGGSGSLRLDIWGSTLAMIRDRPLRGYGPDQFLYAYAPRYVAPTAWGERFTSHPHDVLLDFWVRLGIIGVAMALVGGGWCAVRATNALRRQGARDAAQAAAALTLIAAITHGLVDNAYFLHDLAMSAWLLLWLAGPAPAPRRAREKGSLSVEGVAGWRRWIHRLAPV